MLVYLILAASAFAAQAVLVVPIVPILLGAGVLAAQGRMHSGWAVMAVVVGVEAGDLVWYVLGRTGGKRVLKRVCRITVQPDTCVRKTQQLVGRYGARALVIAKFIPGLSTVALPLAGANGMLLRRFLLYDGSGVLLWSVAYFVTGYVSTRHVLRGLRAPKETAIIIAAAVLVVYFAWNYVRRRRSRRLRRIDGITVDELQRLLASGEDVLVIDVRHRLDLEIDPYAIPHAVLIPAEQLRDRVEDIPRDRDIVLYCTCPDEATSAEEAVRLRASGIRRVRPLTGGFEAWRARGLPVDVAGPAIPREKRTLNAA
jgi:membrane protein DedA with SNARE-associated domain/rhodanese-related sulfurtransferase